MKARATAILSATVAVVLASNAFAATPPADPVDDVDQLRAQELSGWDGRMDRVTTRGGSVEFIWNDDLLGILGLQRAGDPAQRSVTVPLGAASRFDVDARRESVRGIAGGEVGLAGDIVFSTGRGRIVVEAPRLVVRPGDALRIDVMGKDGQVLLYVDRVMYELLDDGQRFYIRSADLRVAPALAARIGRPESVDLAIAELKVMTAVAARAGGSEPYACGDPNWPGESVPGGGGARYQADVFMQAFSGQLSRCRATPAGGACDGPGGATDGDVVYTPSSTLINNIANGSIVATIPGDPLGTSTTAHTADVEWDQKFTNSASGPYASPDQHPYLIWNLYRLDTDGSITQVGRSGVKHAFLTTNVGSGCESCNGNHVLGRQCGDTYGTGNNDSNSDLGPRRELLPAAGLWGRCGSIYDTNCDGVSNPSGNTSYDQRLIVKESALDAAANPGATYQFESWYIVRDDINIYNTMASRPFTPSWNGASWTAANGSPFRLGPALDRWIDAGVAAGDLTRNVELVAPEGRAKVAVRVDDLGNGSWRYHYALMNFDFARGVTQGSEPNLRVVRNDGFNRFAVRVGASATISQIAYADGDPARADWIATQTASGIEWAAPDAAASQNWGVMARFSFVANQAPVDGATATLGVTEAGTPASYDVATVKAGGAATPSAPDLVNDSGRSSIDNITNAADPIFTGTCQSGDSIQLRNGASDVGAPVACTSGNYLITIAGLAEGSYNLAARGSLGADLSAPSAAVAVVVDRTAPAAPAITGPAAIPSIAVTVTGTGGEASAELRLFDGAVQACSTILAGAGNWSCNATLAGPGLRTVVARQTDAAGNVGADSAGFDIDVSGFIFANGFETPVLQ